MASEDPGHLCVDGQSNTKVGAPGPAEHARETDEQHIDASVTCATSSSKSSCEGKSHSILENPTDATSFSADLNEQPNPPQMVAPHLITATTLGQEIMGPPEPRLSEPMPTIKADPETSDSALKMIKTEQPVEGFSQCALDDRREVSLKNLRAVVESNNLDVLESSVKVAVEILDLIRRPLVDFNHHQALHTWIRQIENLKSDVQKAGRTVVAVAGATGAGKSSLINALLDEVKLLPTNGMRACTAVITEICYNQDPETPYRAEVEFVSQHDWESELGLLFSEFLEDNAIAPAWKDPSSEAGVAYAKVKAVYPQLTHEMLVKSDAEKLARAPPVKDVLGTKLKFSCASPKELHSYLAKYLDSREKGSKTKEMAFWPIVKVVRIFTRADALSTNVCLVDLPGTLDSNAARSAVANKYMAECTAVWIAARIARAADDKAAKDLLGRSSRIQMKFDGAYDNLTFIATQTDGINIRETMDALDTDGQIEHTFTREASLSEAIAAAQTKLHTLERNLTELTDECDTFEDELDVWKVLRKKQAKHQKVYRPAPPTKRARGPKRRRTARQQVGGDLDLDESDMAPLTAEEIKTKVDELSRVLEDKTRQCDEAERSHEAANHDLSELQQEKNDISTMRTWLCIQKRNEYCKEAVRQDFAAGIREIDEEGDQVNDEQYDPSIQKRDYEEVARSLPVYCVSSKAYDQLRKNSERGETRVEGFRTIEDTQIPSLQQHAKNASQKGQIRSNRVFLNQFLQTVNSLTLWASDNDLSLQAGQAKENDGSYETKLLEDRIAHLKITFVQTVSSLKQAILNIVRELFEKKTTVASTYASKQVLSIVHRWSMPIRDGGYALAFGTYRATCKRLGDKTPNPKSRNFNQDLLEPFLLKIADPWDQTFSKAIPNALSSFAASIAKEIQSFHSLVTSDNELRNARSASLRILGHQLKTHNASIAEAITGAEAQLRTNQRDASRLFLPEMKEVMKRIYEQCGAEKGQGCFKRIKDSFHNHCDKNKSSMYKKMGSKTRKKLEKDIEDSMTSLMEECEHIWETIANDYKLVITCSETFEANAVVREAIRDVLYQTDAKFEAALGYAQQDEASAVENGIQEPARPADCTVSESTMDLQLTNTDS